MVLLLRWLLPPLPPPPPLLLVEANEHTHTKHARTHAPCFNAGAAEVDLFYCIAGGVCMLFKPEPGSSTFSPPRKFASPHIFRLSLAHSHRRRRKDALHRTDKSFDFFGSALQCTVSFHILSFICYILLSCYLKWSEQQRNTIFQYFCTTVLFIFIFYTTIFQALFIISTFRSVIFGSHSFKNIQIHSIHTYFDPITLHYTKQTLVVFLLLLDLVSENGKWHQKENK